MALSTQRASAFLSSAAQLGPQQNHDVFLSFRGVDTRNSFVSHLYHELQHRGIKTFKDDPKLERGTTISSELFNAIEESRLAIIVLSPNYASSSWCLDELTKILQCMKSKGTILPVFYNVDPADVRTQRGNFGCAFTEYEERFREDIEKVKRWRAALTEVANLSGLDSKNECERKLIEKIVEWVWRKVHHTLKLLDSTEDMGDGGIGKTTIAKLVHDCVGIHFEVSCFLANIREVSERGNLVDLQRKLLFPILKQQITHVWDEQSGTYFIKNCLCNKKVLLIRDDVNDSCQLEKLVGEKDWFGKGSIIIITTRDERLLVKHDIHISYKVEALGDDDALELFSQNAFKKKIPDEGFWELSKSFVNYARGLPLALKLLGCSVYKRDQDEWKSELEKLRKNLEPKVFDLLKLSYDGLDEMNKNIFLDVAFFHKGKDKKQVIETLDRCGLCGRIGIDALVQKSLLTNISDNIVGMHDLIQEMAFEIVHRECPEEPGRRSRLCNHDDISHVFINNTATNKIQGIALRMGRLEKADWNCEAFSRMYNLKYLEFYNVIISSSPRRLPNSLRIIKWSGYPSRFLPPGFQPNFLISLEMRDNKLVRLWDGRKDLPNLKKMDLCYSENLTATPDFTGIPKLEQLKFEICENLVEIHPSIAFLKWLKYLNLNGCKNVKSLPREVEMDSLAYFSLECCSKVKTIPEFSGQMKNLSSLNLNETSIGKLPSSIGRLVGLTALNIRDCKNLLGLPSAICNLKSLEWLNANGCANIDKLPESLGEMECIEWLFLGGTAIRQVPWSIVRLKNLKYLDFGGCGSQLKYQRNGFVLDSLDGLLSLTRLDLSDCGLCEGDIPGDIGCLSSLVELKLSGNNFVSLPASIRCLSKLRLFRVNMCQRLQQLPHLPSNSTLDINTDNCTSLKMLSGLLKWSRNGEIEMYTFTLRSANCFGLVNNEGCDSLTLRMLWRFLQGFVGQLKIVIPGKKIPEWFSNQSVGDSLTVELPPDSCSTWIGIAFCAVFRENQTNPADDLSEFPCFRIDCSAGGEFLARSDTFKRGNVVSDHLWVIYVSREKLKRKCGQIKVLLETYYSQYSEWSPRKYCSSVKKCGLRLVLEQDVEELNQIMMDKSIITSTTTSPSNSADTQGQQRDVDDGADPKW
ncbi:PREDICTED: TMV resistance N [Prunus dulcis]|uniref:ADP-ribosyl cyclase/cyclic ADP-ribose hydrolase n=1 Tax=Prunus dulcis TaxID=3755 RepID=A0A5E4FWP7_PRUDU|nr:PREDICTED: TMV resistance N [Prunus dulcis]